MSKRDRALKQRLEELFSNPPEAEAVETPSLAEANVDEPALPPLPQATVVEPATASAASFDIWKTALEQLPLPIYIKNREHTWVAATPAFGAWIDRPVPALIGHTDKEQSDEAWQQDDQVLETALADESQTSTPLPDGSICTRRVRRIPLNVVDGQAQYVLGVIDEAVQAPASAAVAAPVAPEPATEFKQAFEHTAVGMALVAIDGHFLQVNRAWCALLGYAEDELRQMRFRELTHPDDVEGSVTYLRKMLAGEIDSFKAEKRYIHKQGHIVWVELFSVLLRDQNHQPLYFISQIENIRERKQVELALRESEERYRDLVENSQDLICTHDLQGRILSTNRAAAKFLEYDDPNMFVGMNIRDILVPEARDHMFKVYLTAVKKRGHASGLMHVQTRTGERRVWEYHNTLRAEGVAEPIVRGMARDVTERERVTAELQRRNTQLTALNRVGQELTSLAEPAEILESIYTAIGELLDNRNLYIALYDDATQQITFPLYTIDGERREVAGRPFGNGLTEHILRTKAPLLIPSDVQTATERPGIAGIGRAAECWLAVPLLAGDEAIGVIALQNYQEANAYTANDLELLSTLAAQAAIALENARLFTTVQHSYEATQATLTTQARRALQLQTAAEITSAAATMLNLDELLPMVVELVRDRFDLYYVGLFLSDSANQWATLRAATGEAGRQMLEAGHRLEIGGTSMIGHCTAVGEVHIALDASVETVRFNNPLLPRTRSEMALPLTSRGRVIGALTIQSEQLSAFSSEDVAVLQMMSNQLATTIENAGLLAQTRRVAERQQMLAAMSDKIYRATDVKGMLEVATEELRRTTGSARAVVRLKRPDLQTHRPVTPDEGVTK